MRGRSVGRRFSKRILQHVSIPSRLQGMARFCTHRIFNLEQRRLSRVITLFRQTLNRSAPALKRWWCGWRTASFAQPRPESVALIQLAQAPGVRCGSDELVVTFFQHHIAFHGDQAARLRQPVQGLAQILADHAANLRRMRDDFIQRTILGEPFHRRFRADLFHARHVVHGVAGQC